MSLPASGSHPGAYDEPLITALVAERCPNCGARLGPAAQWCSLCFADLRPTPSAPSAPSAPSDPATPGRAGVPPHDALPSPRDASTADGVTSSTPAGSTAAAPAGTQPSPGTTARPTWPCTSCGVSVDVDLDACPACGTGFLGALRSTSSGIELPVVGNLGRFSDRSRVVLGAAVGLLIALVLVLITALLGR